MRRFYLIGIIVLSSSLLYLPARAQSAPSLKGLRGEIFCFPAKKVPKLVKKLSEVKDTRRDVVDIGLMPRFLIKDGGDWPERFFIRTGTEEINIPIKKPSGETPEFLKVAKANPSGDICVQDKARANRLATDEGLYFEMGLAPLFHNRSGEHDLEELSEGTKDGKSFYKKMIPGPLALIMPETKYLAVRYDDFRREGSKKKVMIYARVNGKDILLMPEAVKDLHIVPLKTLKDMGASALVVKGGAYQLQPTVSANLMKKFGWDEVAEDE